MGAGYREKEEGDTYASIIYLPGVERGKNYPKLKKKKSFVIPAKGKVEMSQTFCN